MLLSTYQSVMNLLNKNSGDRLLDTGCGRGLIALKIATWTNTSVVGVNIDETQIKSARRRAFDAGMENRLEFHHQESEL